MAPPSASPKEVRSRAGQYCTSENRKLFDPFNAMLSRPEDAGSVHGPLAGVRLCVKDNIEVKGEPFTAGHPLFEQRRGQFTASSVTRLLAAGAAFVGMTRTDSGGFGMRTPAVLNPKYPGCTVGGSSGGAAAAVAAGIADLGLGTDTGGSIRVPAACTGLFGFKPSYGRIPCDGVYPLASSFDHLGLLARELSVLTLAADQLLLPSNAENPMDSAIPPDHCLTIAIDEQSPAFEAPEIRAAFVNVVEILRRAGHRIVPRRLPDRYQLTAKHSVHWSLRRGQIRLREFFGGRDIASRYRSKKRTGGGIDS